MHRTVGYRLDYKYLAVNMMNACVLKPHVQRSYGLGLLSCFCMKARKSLPPFNQLLIQTTCYTPLHQHRMYWSVFITVHLDLSAAEIHEVIIVLAAPDGRPCLSAHFLRAQVTCCIQVFCNKCV